MTVRDILEVIVLIFHTAASSKLLNCVFSVTKKVDMARFSIEGSNVAWKLPFVTKNSDKKEGPLTFVTM